MTDATWVMEKLGVEGGAGVGDGEGSSTALQHPIDTPPLKGPSQPVLPAVLLPDPNGLELKFQVDG